mgnify:CR=1 FL=1
MNIVSIVFFPPIIWSYKVLIRIGSTATLFEIDKEVVAYSSKEEAVELVRHYLEHSEESEKIAKAGQERTLRDHTYAQRMKELVPILKRHMV